MKFSDLLLFKQANDRLSADALTALDLPMPDDVLEQFVVDHGLNPDFQAKYGHLDIHQLSWFDELLPRAQILQCRSNYDSYIEQAASCFATPDAALARYPHEIGHSWRAKGTWARPPVFLKGVLPPPDDFFLVEGHTRVGALRSFAGNRTLPFTLAPAHRCWIGAPGRKAAEEHDWKRVRASYPISFWDWLCTQREVSHAAQLAARATINTQDEHRDRPGETFEELASYIDKHGIGAPSKEALKTLHEQWRHALSE